MKKTWAGKYCIFSELYFYFRYYIVWNVTAYYMRLLNTAPSAEVLHEAILTGKRAVTQTKPIFS